MPSGGARHRAGPPPDPNALRRERKSDAAWLTLPITGRSGTPPRWPLTGRSRREATLWKRMWAKPQAVAWESLGQVDEVALYVRTFAAAEVADASVSRLTLLRQMGDSLGLTIPGMRSNRWRIGEVESSAVPVNRGKTARDRLRVVDGR